LPLPATSEVTSASNAWLWPLPQQLVPEMPSEAPVTDCPAKLNGGLVVRAAAIVDAVPVEVGLLHAAADAAERKRTGARIDAANAGSGHVHVADRALRLDFLGLREAGGEREQGDLPQE
jgi:hypothetical protein